MLEVNTLGTVNGTLAALELMRPPGRGHVINIVSLAGLGAPPGEAYYAATKHAALGFTLGTLADLRRDGVEDIHLSAVCPDGIWTPMIADKLDDPDAAPSFSGHAAERHGRRAEGRRPARPPAGRAHDPALARLVRARCSPRSPTPPSGRSRCSWPTRGASRSAGRSGSSPETPALEPRRVRRAGYGRRRTADPEESPCSKPTSTTWPCCSAGRRAQPPGIPLVRPAVRAGRGCRPVATSEESMEGGDSPAPYVLALLLRPRHRLLDGAPRRHGRCRLGRRLPGHRRASSGPASPARCRRSRQSSTRRRHVSTCSRSRAATSSRAS